MKKLMLIVLLAISTQASADGHHEEHYAHHASTPVYYGPSYYTPSYYSPGYYVPTYPAPVVITQPRMDMADLMVPMLFGGVIGYALAEQKAPERVQTPSNISNEPVYQYKTIHDAQCDCDRRVLVRMD